MKRQIPYATWLELDTYGLSAIATILHEWVNQPKYAEWAFLFATGSQARAAYPPLCDLTGFLDARREIRETD